MKVFICHKCGLPRRTEPDSDFAEELGYCECWGRTEFEYERTPRTVKEAKAIAKQRYKEIVELYKKQELRTQYDFDRLRKKYA